MTAEFIIPKAARVERVVPKNKFYHKSELNTRQKELFQDVQRIKIVGKLAPDTLSITKKQWPEVLVLQIELREANFDETLLKIIDTAIPYPILFVLKKDDLTRYAISYKELNQKNANITKVDTIFMTDWNDGRVPQIQGISTDAIYANFLRQIAGDKLKNSGEQKSGLSEVKTDVDQMKERTKIQKQIEALDRKIKNEPSIGKRAELAKERYRLQQLVES